MAYQLQPNLSIIENPAIPPSCATDFVFSYPETTNLNYCGRPNTMVYGTAPYMAGKGAPGDLVMDEDELRPQSTVQHNKSYVDTYEKNMFPLQNMQCSQPVRVWSHTPGSTRAEIQNSMYKQRYCGK